MAISGSEIVGLVPLGAILQAAEFYMVKENLMIVEEDQKVRLAVNRLGLSSLHPFKPRQEFHQFFPLLKNFSFYMIRRISAVVYN